MSVQPPEEKSTNGLLASLLGSVKHLEASTETSRREVRGDLKEVGAEMQSLREDFNSARLEDVTILTELQGRSERNTEDIKELRSQNRKWRWGEGIVASILTGVATFLAFLKGQ